MVRQTSLQAYEEIIPELGDRQEEVLNALYKADKPLTDKEISNRLHRPINTITPRRNELMNKGMVLEAKRRECSITGRKAIAWKVRPSVTEQLYEERKSKREKKAEEEDMAIEQIEPFFFKVKDKYFVDIEDETCTCPDYEYRHEKCKHIIKVEKYMEDKDGRT